MRRILIMFLLIHSICVFSQVDSTSTGEVVDAEIVIEKDRQIRLPVKGKLNTAARKGIRNTPPLKLTYEQVQPAFTWPKYKSEVSFEKLSKKFPTAQYQNSIRFGYGNYSSPLLEVKYFHSLDKVKLSSEFFHESFKEGPIATTNSFSSETKFNIGADYQGKSVRLVPTLDISTNGFRFYGNTDRVNTGFNSETTSKVFRSNVDFSLGIFGGSGDLTYSIKPAVYSANQSIKDGLDINGETGFAFASEVDLKVDKAISAGFDIEGNAAKYDGGLEYNRSLFTLQPWLAHNSSELKLKGGFGFSTAKTDGGGSQTGLYPFFGADWKFKPKWTLFGEFRSGIEWNSLYAIAELNQFLDDSLTVQNSEVTASLSGGIKGTVTNNLALESGVKWESVNSLPFYIPSGTDSSRYVLTYDNGSTEILAFDIQARYSVSTSTSVGSKLSLFNYTTSSLEKAWHLPSYVFTFFFSKNIKEKFFINSELIAQGGIEAPGATNIEVLDLASFVDLNLNLDYKATERFSTFLKLNNLFNKEYERYIGYPVRGASFKVGGKYRF